MRRLTAILFIVVILSAPVSRYAGYIHCLAMNALSLQKDCGCDLKLIPINNSINDNSAVPASSISVTMQNLTDWVCDDDLLKLSPAFTTNTKHVSLYINLYSSAYVFAKPRPPAFTS